MTEYEAVVTPGLKPRKTMLFILDEGMVVLVLLWPLRPFPLLPICAPKYEPEPVWRPP